MDTLLNRRHWLLLSSLALALGCQSEAEESTSGRSVRASRPIMDGEVNPSLEANLKPAHLETKGDLQFVRGFVRGFERARQQGRPAMLFFTADWCTFCKQMEREAFRDQSVIDLSRHFVCVLVDADEETEVCREFDVDGFPTIVFLLPNGAQPGRLIGKQPSVQLADEMQSVLRTAARWMPGSSGILR
ncbi:MAG: thioredoxin family protein [Pirellulales bacterium]